MRERKLAVRNPARVTVLALINWIVIFALGIVAGILYGNSMHEQGVSLSTPSVISLFFTVALGAASIVLAVIAISLSRNAEDAIIQRSDEGLHLQNEVFLRTNEVLMKIQSSTGVTEKRIEDIIAGRTGAIAQEAVERSLDKDRVSLSPAELMKIRTELAESLRQEIRPLLTDSSSPGLVYSDAQSMHARDIRGSDIRVQFSAFKGQLIEKLKMLPSVSRLNRGQGKPSGRSKEEFWDATCVIDGKLIGICVFIGNHFMDPAGSFYYWQLDAERAISFARSLVIRIQEDEIDLAILACDTDLSMIANVSAVFSNVQSSVGAQRFHFIFGALDDIIKRLLAETSKYQQ